METFDKQQIKYTTTVSTGLCIILRYNSIENKNNQVQK